MAAMTRENASSQGIFPVHCTNLSVLSRLSWSVVLRMPSMRLMAADLILSTIVSLRLVMLPQTTCVIVGGVEVSMGRVWEVISP